MAEEVRLSPLAKSIIEKLSNSFIFQPTITYTNEQANNAISVEDEFQTIRNNMESVYAVLADAEKKQSANNSIKFWLRDLKCIVYDIDDLLDEAVTDSLQHNVKNGDFRPKFRYPFRSFHLTTEMLEIGAKLECVVAKMDEFGLVETENELLNNNIRDHDDDDNDYVRDYYSKYNPIIIGRDEAKHEILSKVLSVSNADSLSVLPIVGMSGIGKTTLAKLVHSDVQNFDIKLWVCVTEKDVNYILSNIIQQVNGVNIEDSSKNNHEELIEKINELLNGKKYFLVLDDMRLDDELEWKKLEESLPIGKEGSMVLITSRNVKFASTVKTMEPYMLGGLQKHECWSIFKQLAFEGVADEDARYSNLQKIGKSIVGKCGGIPLVVRVLASMLRFEDVHEWQRIKDNINDDSYDAHKIMQLLKISYDKLKPQLKQCLAYMSLYPKNHVYNSSEIVDIGIALGLFKQVNGNKESKKSAIDGFELHDLIHDLATNILGDELVDVATTENMAKVSCYTRHVIWRHECSSSNSLAPKELATELGKAKKLRTFRLLGVNIISCSVLEEIISKLEFLRILDLSGGLMEELPKSIGKLKHLRYLDLTKNVIIQGLPNTICKLVNLDTFHTKGCVRLKELPKDMYLLLRLRKFSVTTLQQSLISTKTNELSSLQHLEIYSCPRLVSLWGSDVNAEGLITSLRSLIISGCPKMTRLPDCIKYLVNLERLTLQDCQELDLEEGQEALQGLQNLEELYISSLPKIARLPHAIILSAKPSLRTLEIDDCKGLIHLVDPLKDWFGEFQTLHYLVIKRCPNLLTFPNSICRLDTLENILILESPHLAKSCSLTPQSKALDFTLIHHVLNIQIDDAILTKKRNHQIQHKRYV
ncbi:putative disease resistance protein RGA1 [Bienertia sinuspersici]